MNDQLRKAIAEAAQMGGLLLKSQMAFDFTASAQPAHHVAYLRTNARGTTSRIEAKGSPTNERPVTVQHADPPQGHRIPAEPDSIAQAREAGRKAGTIGAGSWQNPHRDEKHAQAWHDGHSEGNRDWIDAGHSAQQTKDYDTIRADAEARRSRRQAPEDAHQAQRTRVEAERAAAIAMVKPQMTLAEIKAAIYTQHVSTEDFIGDLKVGQTTTLKTADGRQRVKIIEDSPVAALITQVETTAQGLLTNPAMEPYRHDITEMLKDLKNHPSAAHAQVVIHQLKAMTEEATGKGNPYKGNPKKLIDDITRTMNITYGVAHQRKPLQLKVRHDENMVTITYKDEAGPGFHMGITKQVFDEQRAAFAAAAPRIMEEISKRINVEDHSIEISPNSARSSIFFVSDDMTPVRRR